MSKLTIVQREHLKRLVLDCIIQRLSIEESMVYINARLDAVAGGSRGSKGKGVQIHTVGSSM